MSIQMMTQVWKLPDLTQAQKLVLLSLADNSNDDGICWPSITAIASRCCMAPRSVTRTVNELEDAGYVKRDIRHGKKTVYHVTPDRQSPLTESHPDIKSSRPIDTTTPDRQSPTPDGESPLPQTPYKEITLKEPSIEITPKAGGRRKKSEVPPKYTERFVEFWRVYPRRDGSKFEAAESFHRFTTEGISHDLLIDGARKYAEYHARISTPPDKLAHATTWLNGRRWEAEYAACNGTTGPQPASKTSASLDALRDAGNRNGSSQPVEPDPVRRNDLDIGHAWPRIAGGA